MFIEEKTQVEKRRFRRARFSDAISYRLKDVNHFGGCLGCDISEGGVRIQFNDFVPINTEMVLQMKLSNIPKVIDVTGRVVWLQQVPYSDRYQIGLQFTKADPIYHEEIRSYVKTHPS